MSRRRASFKREVTPDPIYNDLLIAKFVNKIMIEGKKSLAQKVVYGALEEIKQKVTAEEPLAVLKKAVENVKPQLEVRTRRIGGANYQIPVDVRPVRRITLALRWIVSYARERGEKTMSARLAGELLDAFNSRGNSIKKKDDVHKMAEANRAFSHFKS